MEDIKYIGVNDYTLDLFENQYVVPNGMSYNSYVIMDEKIAVMDTVDERATDEWLDNLKEVLGDRSPDYLVVSHMESDHGANIQRLCELYPQMKIVGNMKTFNMMGQFFRDFDFNDKKIVVKERGTLELGEHTLTFYNAPMVHWPEVMVAYESKEKVLFSADAFGKFGTIDADEEWDCEARRYYFNICGKYGRNVQALLKKVKNLEIETICSLHGPILESDLDHYINLYDLWSSYQPEVEGVYIACASIHGNSMKAAEYLYQLLEATGVKVSLSDLCREDPGEAVEDAFKYSKMVLIASSYDTGVFTPMEDFLHHLVSKGYTNRTVALVENASWAPSANRAMKAILDTMKGINVLEDMITIKSTMDDTNKEQFKELVESLK